MMTVHKHQTGAQLTLRNFGDGIQVVIAFSHDCVGVGAMYLQQSIVVPSAPVGCVSSGVLLFKLRNLDTGREDRPAQVLACVASSKSPGMGLSQSTLVKVPQYIALSSTWNAVYSIAVVPSALFGDSMNLPEAGTRGRHHRRCIDTSRVSELLSASIA
jgi:hypothetical protein